MNHPLGPEQLLEQRLSIFAGSFSLEAIKAIFTHDEIKGEKLASLLDHLVSQGKIETEGQGDNRRYWLSEERRPVGKAQLSASGAEDAVYSHLVDYYLGLAERSLEEAFGPERAMWLNRLEQEHINLQSVFTWLVERGEAERGLRLAYSLQELWFEDHHTSEARTLFTALLALPAASARTRTRAEYLDLVGAFALNQNDYAKARSLKQQGVAICRELEDSAALGRSLIHLGRVELYAGELPAAQRLYQEALQIFCDLGDQRWTAYAIDNLGRVKLELGDYVTANKLVQESLQRYRDLNLEWELALTIGNAAGVAAGLGQLERSIRLAGASAAHRERIGVSLPPAFKDRFERIIESARQALAESAQAKVWEEGQAMTLEQAAEYALATDDQIGTFHPS
jgi:non-specific serine/threonine protein kinase